MSDKAFDYLLGKIPVDEALEFDEVGVCRYSPLLEGYVLTIRGEDYFVPTFPKDGDSPTRIQCIKVTP